MREWASSRGASSYLWFVYHPLNNISLFEWHTGRAAACLESLVPSKFTGLIHCDGYSAYESFIKSPARKGSIPLAGCLAHARRKFFEAACPARRTVHRLIPKVWAAEQAAQKPVKTESSLVTG